MGLDDGGQVKTERRPSGPAFWVGLVLGWAVIGYGIVGLVRNADDTHPLNFLGYFAGSVLAHDFLLAPLVLAVGWYGVRRLRGRARAAATAALIISGTVTLYALPFVLELGRDPDNPSRLPNNYGAALAIVVAVVSATAWVWTRATRLDVTRADEAVDDHAEDLINNDSAPIAAPIPSAPRPRELVSDSDCCCLSPSAEGTGDGSAQRHPDESDCDCLW
jgi:hypothetical protein